MIETFSLADIPGFPQQEYEDILARAAEAERWFTGQALTEKSSQGDQIELYPLKINPIFGTVVKHAAMLFGDPEDDGRSLVYSKIVARDQSLKDSAKIAEETLNDVWFENHGRSLMMQGGILSQIYGGCVFKATYVPWETDREIPIRIELLNPKCFVGIADGSDNFRLLAAWVIRKISLEEAIQWGYVGSDDYVYYVEHWTRQYYKIWIDGKPATWTGGGETVQLGGDNPFGFVPMVYIPHLRATDFYGINAFDQLKGEVTELNLRFGDYGDAVNDDAHSYTAMRNVNGSPQVRRIAEGLPVIDLGSAPNISGQEPQPDLFEIRKQRANTAMRDLVHEVYAQYRRDSFVPAVAEGEDEGSQRSSLTLATRFWPLTSHLFQERIFWTDGLNVFQRYLLLMMFKQKLAGITQDMLGMRMKQKWANMLPRDREVDVQEWVSRASGRLGSIETLLELTGDIENIEEEKAKILAWEQALLDMQTDAQVQVTEAQGEMMIQQVEAQAKLAPAPGEGGGGGGQRVKPPSAKKVAIPAKAGGKTP